MPWQIIPIDSKPPINIDTQDYNVITYIQIDRENQLAEKISKLMASSQFLLFLMCRNIHMSFVHNGTTKCDILKETDGEFVVLSSNRKVDSRWLSYTNESVEVPDEVRQSIANDINTPLKLKEADSFDLSFAIALDDKGHFRKLEDSEAVVYTYLPTSFKFGGTGFPFLVNANFITDAGRQQLHKDSEWNKLIFSKIPGEFLSWMKTISDRFDNYYEVLPQKSYGNEDLLQVAYAANMEKAIDEIAFIPSEKEPKTKLLAKNAVMDKMEIGEKISKEVLTAHLNRTYKKSFENKDFIKKVWKGSGILAEYGVFIFDKQKIKALFEDEFAFVNLTPELDVRLIDYLFEYFCKSPKEQDDLMNLLKETKFLLDDKNNLSIPVGLFFPSDYAEQNEMAGDADVLNKEIYEAIRSRGELYKWLLKLGMEEMSDATFIKNVLCKSGYVTKENAIEVARFLFNCKIDIFEEVGNYYLSNISFLTKKGELELAENIYLGSKYKPEIDIEKAYDGDIFVSEEYVGGEDVTEWSVFFKKMGVKDRLAISKIILKDTKGYFLLNQVKEKYSKDYNVGSWGTHFLYCFNRFEVSYIPFILTSDCKIQFQQIIWDTILSDAITKETDMVCGMAGSWQENRAFSYYDCESFLPWMIKNVQKFPSTTKELLKSTELFQNTEDISKVAGTYLPVIDVSCQIHEDWLNLLNLKNVLHFEDYLTILAGISHDIENGEDNKERVSTIYQRLIDLDVLISDEKKTRIKEWAKNHKILSQNGELEYANNLSYITLEGFSAKARAYIGKPSDRDKVIDLMQLMGVRVITHSSIKPDFGNYHETNEIKKCLANKTYALALLAAGDNSTKHSYKQAKATITTKINETRFYNCSKICLTYGNSEDIIEKTTFGLDKDFYYTGNLRPANLEPLMAPLCKHLGIKDKTAELFIIMIEDKDGIIAYLKEKGYDVSLIDDENIPEASNTDKIFETKLNHTPSESQDHKNHITGFKGEIIIYEYLKRHGYEPICPSISTIDDYDCDVSVNGKTYYCKKNYERYDITFKTNNGTTVYVEVKSTVNSIDLLQNMPISSQEWRMIDECDNSQEDSYVIARVFDVDSSNPDVYFLKGHKIDIND